MRRNRYILTLFTGVVPAMLVAGCNNPQGVHSDSPTVSPVLLQTSASATSGRTYVVESELAFTLDEDFPAVRRAFQMKLTELDDGIALESMDGQFKLEAPGVDREGRVISRPAILGGTMSRSLGTEIYDVSGRPLSEASPLDALEQFRYANPLSRGRPSPPFFEGRPRSTRPRRESGESGFTISMDEAAARILQLRESATHERRTPDGAIVLTVSEAGIGHEYTIDENVMAVTQHRVLLSAEEQIQISYEYHRGANRLTTTRITTEWFRDGESRGELIKTLTPVSHD